MTIVRRSPSPPGPTGGTITLRQGLRHHGEARRVERWAGDVGTELERLVPAENAERLAMARAQALALRPAGASPRIAEAI